MSFKRAGDDHCALRLQKKQRVAELFQEDIPADEVSKTRSGRFVCLVCPHNPVLDTMPMLSIHRQGKKHLTNMSIKVEKEHNLSELRQKREQELYLKETELKNEPLNAGLPSRNVETNPLLAKTRQLMESVVTRLGDTNSLKTHTEKNRMNELGGRRPQKNKPFFQSRVELKLSEDVFNKDNQISKRFSPINNSTTKKIEHRLDCSKDRLSKSGCDGRFQKEILSLAVKEKNTTTSIQNKMSKVLVQPTDSPCSSQVNSSIPTGSGSTVKDGLALNPNIEAANGLDKIEQQKRYLDLRMSGWIMDHNGKWIKDENVEFDSDEDVPNET